MSELGAQGDSNSMFVKAGLQITAKRVLLGGHSSEIFRPHPHTALVPPPSSSSLATVAVVQQLVTDVLRVVHFAFPWSV